MIVAHQTVLLMGVHGYQTKSVAREGTVRAQKPIIINFKHRLRRSWTAGLQPERRMSQLTIVFASLTATGTKRASSFQQLGQRL